MKYPQNQLLPLGDFLPTDEWQTHVNDIFYGIKGPEIHNHFQTYVSLDHRLAHTLADDFFQNADKTETTPVYIMEWGVGNGNLAARFLSHLKELDIENNIYPRVLYLLCDYSDEIIKGVHSNPNLEAHKERFKTVRLHAENFKGFKTNSISKIISNEIWDDLATKVLLKNQGFLYEEYIQPLIDPKPFDIDWEKFVEMFSSKNLEYLKNLPPFLDQIYWERTFQRVDITDWPFAKTISRHLENIEEEIPTPINVGAFNTIKWAKELLILKNQGYSSFDYGMLSLDYLNQVGRPYFKIYGGQYTSMVNFPLLAEIAGEVGFNKIHFESQQTFVEKYLGEKIVSAVDLVQNHPNITRLDPWDVDILMLQTLHALNTIYKNPYLQKMVFPPMPGTPKKPRKLIKQLTEKLSPRGVPDTVAYVTKEEVFSALKPLRKLGYREKDLTQAFFTPSSPIQFGYMNLQ